MAIESTQLLIKYSTPSGTAGNLFSGTAATSLGGYISQTEIVTSTEHNLFLKMQAAETATASKSYRCAFLHNSNGSLGLQNTVIWVSATNSVGTLRIGVDSTAASLINASSQQAVITSEGTAPAGIAFYGTAISKVTALSMGSIRAGYCKAFWVEREAPNYNVTYNNDSATFTIEGDSET